ncbi:type I-D CRISPR-associated helicase Cas3' [Halanaerobacter jeridensis]|uniref:CRISPR-associated endonuclease/helicase Cas3 n=1 Tax=Halanaerobacter jeridensis TaxID=706427 RepID=A0A938XUU0_9FIRM|nr:type I-D CRISPR-associated helicase Cas3' [Halanaerobacter jeridensis]MBM7555645.1 CRISPR-associated endonuclease/helicase Cas3 [Halanaerobacter jeridensis]
MIELNLKEDYEVVAQNNPFDLKYTPLKHQLKTYQALQDNQIVINLHNTGTGKTLASLLYLFDLESKMDNVLFIAPTNELIYQHTQDIKDFISENDLKYNVINIDASRLKKLTSQAKRNGDKLHRLLKNPLEFAEELDLEFNNKDYPFVFVTNPDIFYYALYFQYHHIDQRNLCQDFATLFSYIVIDEFHYYNSKQFANFLFFFALSQEFGYFEQNRKICLLSATPAQYVIDYLDRLNLNQKIIDLEEESEEKIQTLTTAKVEMIAGNLIEEQELVEKKTLNYLEKGLEGVVISNSLARINKLFSDLDYENKERITGPQSRQAREIASKKDLILATPTVDIGYNFAKDNKQRQNIDFVILEANSVDELLQRLGRAGRVLGKEIKDWASKILILIDGNSYNLLVDELENREYQRKEFADLLVELNAPPQKKEFVQYIKSYALLESFYPLYKMYCTMPDHIKEYIEKLFESLREVFNGNKSFRQLLGITSKFRHQQQVAEQGEELSLNDYQDFCYWFENRTYSEEVIKEYTQNPGITEKVKQFVKQEYATKKSLFNFRDSFTGPQAVIYDPRDIFATDQVVTYNLLHIIRNYKYTLYSSAKKFKEQVFTKKEGDFYIEVEDFREEKIDLSYRLKVPYPGLFNQVEEIRYQEFFESKFCNRPVALPGLELVSNTSLDPEIIEFFKEEFISMFIVSNNLNSKLYSSVKNSAVYPVKLEVVFPNYTSQEYRMILGTAAFLVYPEMERAIYAAKNQEDESPVII